MGNAADGTFNGPLNALSYLEADTPAAGMHWRFLVRGRNSCAEGSWGNDSAGIPRVP